MEVRVQRIGEKNADRRANVRKYIYVFSINDKHSILTAKHSLLVAYAPNTPPVGR